MTTTMKPNNVHVLLMQELDEDDPPTANIIVVGHDVDALKRYALEFQAELSACDEEEFKRLEKSVEWELSDHSDLEFWWRVSPHRRYEVQPADELV